MIGGGTIEGRMDQSRIVRTGMDRERLMTEDQLTKYVLSVCAPRARVV